MENREIGQKPTLNPKSQITDWTTQDRHDVLTDSSMPVRVQFEISDFGFKVGFYPISNCLQTVPPSS
jgi:hypothetical protein